MAIIGCLLSPALSLNAAREFKRERFYMDLKI